MCARIAMYASVQVCRMSRLCCVCMSGGQAYLRRQHDMRGALTTSDLGVHNTHTQAYTTHTHRRTSGASMPCLWSERTNRIPYMILKAVNPKP